MVVLETPSHPVVSCIRFLASAETEIKMHCFRHYLTLLYPKLGASYYIIDLSGIVSIASQSQCCEGEQFETTEKLKSMRRPNNNLN